MRAYFFTNYYLNTISQGIQPGHCAVEFFVKYMRDTYTGSAERSLLYSWADHGKTFICLNGGDYFGVLDAFKFLEAMCPKLGLPFAAFHEDERSLGGLMTTCGVVVPDYLYEAAAAARQGVLGNQPDLTENEAIFVEFLNRFGLAK